LRAEVDRLIQLGRDREAAELAARGAMPGASVQLDETITPGEPDRDGRFDEPGEECTMLSPLEQFDQLIPLFRQTSAACDDAVLGAATPCEGWVVRDLLAHVNGGARAFAAAFEGGEVRARELGDDPVPVVIEALTEFDAAIRVPGALERTLDTPFGTLPGEAFARLAAFDLLMHTWDLAQATGQDLRVPEEVVMSVDQFARGALTDEWRRPGVFGDEVTAAPTASALDRLAAFAGRPS
jgi:uncharacterized protein (TIGR03086 family)